ncbi:hypothetical protein J2Z84_000247 [Agrobacterium rubi]|nr:hypothetical protein [Agrobacterium rubi]
MKIMSACTLLIALLSAPNLMATNSFANVCNPITKSCSGGHPG